MILRYEKLPAGSRVLEAGCGSGKFSLALAALGHKVVALDYVPEVLRGVRTAGRQLEGRWPGQIRSYCRGSVERLPFDCNAFDLVLNEGVIEHWLDDATRLAVLREMVRVARPGECVAIFVPNGRHPLIRLWETRLEAFRSAPPMTHYDATRLKKDLTAAGLQKVYTDGIYPWRSWMRLPPWDRLYLLGAALDRWAILPHSWRERWAINLVGMGRKPLSSGSIR